MTASASTTAPTVHAERTQRGPLTVLIRQRGQVSNAPSPATLRDPIQPMPDDAATAQASRDVPVALSVEDSPVHLKILSRYLEQVLGCRVLQAGGVETAVSLLLRERPNLVVTDLLMPDLDGLDLVAVLHSRAEWSNIPVLVHSAVSDANRIQNLAGLGIKDYILKPFDPTVAIPRLRKVLSEIEKTDQAQTTPRPETTGRIPIVLASTNKDTEPFVQDNAGPLYQVIHVPSGPAAIIAAIEIQPWMIFLTPDLGPWDLPKTTRSLRSLKCLEKVPVVHLPAFEKGTEPVVDLIHRELRPAPFTLESDSRLITVTVEDNFAPSCASAMDRAIEQALRPETEQIVFEIPSQGIGWHVTPLLRELAKKARSDGDADGE